MNRSRQRLSRRRLLAGAGSGALALLAGAPVRRRRSALERLGMAGAASNTLNVASPTDPAGFDPQTRPNPTVEALSGALFSGLLRFQLDADPSVSFQHTVEPDLVARWESPDAVTWVLHLRPDATFLRIPPVNGHAVEAEDVRASLQRGAQAARNEGRAVAAMFDATAVETPDRLTVLFRLPRPYAPLPWFLASLPDGLVLPREALAGAYDPNTLPIGSGPFFLASYEPGDALALQRNATYFEQGLPSLDGVNQAIVASEDDRVAQFAAGTLDVIRVSQPVGATAAAQNPAAQVISAVGDANDAIFFQLGAAPSPFLDLRLRQAVSEAIDRASIGQALFAGQYELPFAVSLTMGPWALQWDGLDPSLRRLYTYNPADAALLLRAAGYEGSAVTLAYPAGVFGATFETMAQMIAGNLAALNWSVTLAPIDYQRDYLGDGSGYRYGNIPSSTVLLGRIPAFTNVDQYLFDLYDSRSPGNIERLRDPRVDAMIDQARTVLDPRALQQGYLDVQRYIAGQMFSVGALPAGYCSVIAQPWVQNLVYAPEAASVGRSWLGLAMGS